MPIEYAYYCYYCDESFEPLDQRLICPNCHGSCTQVFDYTVVGPPQIPIPPYEEEPHLTEIIDDDDDDGDIDIDIDNNNNNNNSNGETQQRPTRAVMDCLTSIAIRRSHVNSQTSCPVCQDTFTLRSEVKALPCNHIYHSDCIVLWLIEHSTCPVCRSELPPPDHSSSSSSSRRRRGGSRSR